MHVGGQSAPFDGSARRGQALRDELAAERTLAFRTTGRTDPRIGVRAPLQLEQFQQLAHRAAASSEPVATVLDSASWSISLWLSPSHSASTPAVSSPSAGAATACG